MPRPPSSASPGLPPSLDGRGLVRTRNTLATLRGLGALPALSTSFREPPGSARAWPPRKLRRPSPRVGGEACRRVANRFAGSAARQCLRPDDADDRLPWEVRGWVSVPPCWPSAKNCQRLGSSAHLRSLTTFSRSRLERSRAAAA